MKLTDLTRRLQLYNRALKAYEAKDSDGALRILRQIQALYDGTSLPELILELYIFQNNRRSVSACKTIQYILKRYGNTGDARLGEVWSMLGSVATTLGEMSLASDAFRQSAALESDRAQRLVEFSNAIFTMNHQTGLTPDDWQRAYADYRALIGEVAAYPRQRYGHQRLRVGYLSSDFCTHPVAYFAYALLCWFNTSRFEVFCYAVNQKEDVLTENLRKLPITWRDLRAMDAAQIAAAIHADEIDILVDLAGHTMDNSLPVLAHQPAAVQLSGLGYMGSTGLLNVDGLISDVYCSPGEHSPYGTEPLIRLPRTHWCYTRPHAFPDIAPEPPCLRNGFVTFGCFNNYTKLTDEMLLLWRRILESVPRSRLLLKYQIFDSDELRGHAYSRFARLGMDTARIECRPHSADYLSQYNDMDIALDTSPYCGGLTTCEALYMGVPVLTLMGERHGSRFGFSMLSNLGLGDLVARTPGAYVELAVAMSQSPEFVLALHQRLRGLMSRSPLMDGVGYAQDVGAMYERVYRAKMGGGTQ